MTGAQLQQRVRKQLHNNELYMQVQDTIKEMEEQLKKLCQTTSAEMSQDLERIVMAGGKRLRPTLAWICHRIGSGKKREILPLMCMLELMHTASLIHDDVIDDASLRRGVATIHVTSGRQAAIQSGDFLLARAMEFLSLYKDTGINEALAEISTQMCLGEFQQMEYLYDTERQNRVVYYEQIRRKTAYLIATSCYAGAIAGGLDRQQTEALRSYGEQIGIAFQLKDDILDFVGTSAFGKVRGQDIRRGIFTLPLLYSFENHPDAEMKKLAEKRKKTSKEIEMLLEFVADAKGIEYTEFQIRVCSRRALQSLECIPEGNEKDALIQMARTLVKRKL